MGRRKVSGFAAAYRAAKRAEKQQQEISWSRAFLCGLIYAAILSIPIVVYILTS